MNPRAKYILTGVLAALILLATIGAVHSFLDNRSTNMEKIHVLKFPLLIGTNKEKNYYMLPKGTTLYFDGAMPEGFSRYRIYVNVEGMRLQREDNSPPGAIDPIAAYPIKKQEMLDLLQVVRLDKEDVKAILSSSQFSDEDRHEISDYLQRQISK